MSGSCWAPSLATVAAGGPGNNIRNPVVEMISPPATRMPGNEMPKKSMIFRPATALTAITTKAASAATRAVR